MKDRIWGENYKGMVGKNMDSVNPQQVILKLQVPETFFVVANLWEQICARLIKDPVHFQPPMKKCLFSLPGSCEGRAGLPKVLEVTEQSEQGRKEQETVMTWVQAIDRGSIQTTEPLWK